MVRIGCAGSCGACGQRMFAGVRYQHMSLRGITSFVAVGCEAQGATVAKWIAGICYQMLVPITVQPYASGSDTFIPPLRSTTYIESTHTKKIHAPGAVKDVVRLFGAIGGFERGLDFEGVPEHAEDRPDQIVLGLGLVIAPDIRADNRGDLGEGLGGVVGEQLPLGALRQGDVEIMVGEELLVVVPLGERERELRCSH
jgi:hypothetical protein